MRSLGKATAAIPLRDGPVLRRDFAQTLRVGSKNFTEQFMLDGHARAQPDTANNHQQAA